MVDKVYLNSFQILKPQMTKVTASVQTIQPAENDVRKGDKKKLILPLGMIAGGGLLIYYGIKAPTKSRIIKNIVNERLAQIKANLKIYKDSATDIVENSFRPFDKYIADYLKMNSFSGYQEIFEKITNPKMITKAVDLYMDAIHQSSLRKNRQGNLTDMAQFSADINNVLKNVNENLTNKRNAMALLFEDYAKLPKNKDENLNSLIVSSSAKLRAQSVSTLGQMDVIKYMAIHKTLSKYFAQMAEAITTSREKILKSKRDIIDLAYARVSELLDLEYDLKPSYKYLPSVDNYLTLTPQELQPQKLSVNISESVADDIYFKWVQQQDFNNFTDEDVRRIFYSAPYDNNLEDLKLLIDRLKLQKVISDKTTGVENPEYKILISKFEFLLNKLHEFGISEILKKSSKDFNKMNTEQKRAALYYVNTASRRMGFNSIESMDKFMAHVSEEYSNLCMRNYISMFKRKPELYYF